MPSLTADGLTSDSPRLLGRYELLTQLASGGMANVFVGRRHGAHGFQRVVAIKRMRSHLLQNPEITAQFAEEARIASLVQHPNVVSIHDVQQEGGELFLVMDYIDGASLSELMKELRRRDERAPLDVTLRIVVDALHGLHAAHELCDYAGTPLNVVHRDATPTNILLGRDGSVRITDFGIAKAVARGVETLPGHIKGKFNYMAPEQASSLRLDRRVDVFAMGIVLWELLVGRSLFGEKGNVHALRAVLSAPVAAPSKQVPSVPAALDDVVLRSLERNRDARFATAVEFADAIERVARDRGGLASPTDVARAVALYCLPAILDRETRLKLAITGKAPPLVVAEANGPRLGESSTIFEETMRVTEDAVTRDAEAPDLQQLARGHTVRIPVHAQAVSTVHAVAPTLPEPAPEAREPVALDGSIAGNTDADPFASDESENLGETRTDAARRKRMRTVAFGVIGGAGLLLALAALVAMTRSKPLDEMPATTTPNAMPLANASAPAASTSAPNLEPSPAPTPTAAPETPSDHAQSAARPTPPPTPVASAMPVASIPPVAPKPTAAASSPAASKPANGAKPAGKGGGGIVRDAPF